MKSSSVAACALRNEQAATQLEFMYHSRIVLSVGGSVWYMIRNLRCTVTIDSVLANSKTQNAFLFTVNAIFLHDYPLAVEPGSTPMPLVQKKTWRDSLPIDMLLSAVSVLVVAQSSSDIPEGLTNNPVLHCCNGEYAWFSWINTFNTCTTASDSDYCLQCCNGRFKISYFLKMDCLSKFNI